MVICSEVPRRAPSSSRPSPADRTSCGHRVARFSSRRVNPKTSIQRPGTRLRPRPARTPTPSRRLVPRADVCSSIGLRATAMRTDVESPARIAAVARGRGPQVAVKVTKNNFGVDRDRRWTIESDGLGTVRRRPPSSGVGRSACGPGCSRHLADAIESGPPYQIGTRVCPARDDHVKHLERKMLLDEHDNESLIDSVMINVCIISCILAFSETCHH